MQSTTEKILSIEKLDDFEDEYVYDIEVNDTHTFFWCIIPFMSNSADLSNSSISLRKDRFSSYWMYGSRDAIHIC